MRKARERIIGARDALAVIHADDAARAGRKVWDIVELLFMKKQGTLDRKGLRRRAETRPGRQSRSLFIRTMTVGPGITPGLLTLRLSKRSRAMRNAQLPPVGTFTPP
ncbi:hypothetical protein PSm6_27810 [Pseudomonas solani]|uniref:Uncharacterized protein n=1 Tax=Pseudomonas solani TaxID=2731552 RepID=A0ABM7L9W5_9PSED|nr:hypothetical protein PSm6_27810 [Pseudomonas solani]